MDQWFGTVEGLHLDSWIELNIVDGHKVTISEHAANGVMNLYFINLGAYSGEFFSELYANCFLASSSAKEAKTWAKFLLSNALPGDLHTDDLYDIDDRIKITSIGSHHIGVEPTIETGKMRSMNAYHVIPEAIIQGYLTRNNRLA